MLISNFCRVLERFSRLIPELLFVSALAVTIHVSAGPPDTATPPLQETLKALPYKIAYECYTNDNWEIFVMNPDGSGVVNLTHTPDENEHYPQVSPDATKICFSMDRGEGREAVRSLYIMDIDGSHRKKLLENA